MSVQDGKFKKMLDNYAFMISWNYKKMLPVRIMATNNNILYHYDSAYSDVIYLHTKCRFQGFRESLVNNCLISNWFYNFIFLVVHEVSFILIFFREQFDSNGAITLFDCLLSNAQWCFNKLYQINQSFSCKVLKSENKLWNKHLELQIATHNWFLHFILLF